MSNLRQRILSAIVLLAAVLPLTWIGGLPFRLLAAAAGAAMLWEWNRLNTRAVPPGLASLAWLALTVVLLMMIAGIGQHAVLAAIAIGTVALALAGLAAGRGFAAAGGFAYVALAAVSVAGLRGGDTAGLMALLALFAIVWGTDIFAYFTGRALGGPKLAPAISPGKTISGAIGGAAGAVAAAILVAWFMMPPGDWRVPAAALVYSAVSQAGDLFESWIKRKAGVKDSSNLIPGHGGVLDRLDALVAAAILMYLVGVVAAGFESPAPGIFFGAPAN